MTYKVPLQVSEIKLVYKTKAKKRPQIKSSRDAYWTLESNWSDQIWLLEEFNVLLVDRSNRAMAICSISKGVV